MKIDKDTLEALRGLIAPLDTATVRERYRTGNFPRADRVTDLDTRYRFDLFYAVKGYRVFPEGAEFTTDHIDTALRRIVPPLG